MIKIAHIFDDAIITNATVELFNKISGFDQSFYVLKNTANSKFEEGQKRNELIKIIPLNDYSEAIKRVILENDVIYFQALSYEKAKALQATKFSKKVFIWGLWGYELYNLAAYYNSSESEFATNISEKKSLKKKLIDFYTFKVVYPKAIKKIDFTFFFLKHDFELLNQSVKHHALLHQGCYQTIENLFSKDNVLVSKGNNILIGNSSTPSIRHEFVFEKLKNFELNNRKVIVPLSYGDTVYRKNISVYAKNIFGANFEGLVDYMNLSEYTKILETCSVAIMAHKRQQAFGTILMLVYGGLRVFLSEESPFYDWFKSNGIVLFSIENELTDENLASLSHEIADKNRQALQQILSEEKTLENLTSLLKSAVNLYYKRNGKNISTN